MGKIFIRKFLLHFFSLDLLLNSENRLWCTISIYKTTKTFIDTFPPWFCKLYWRKFWVAIGSYWKDFQLVAHNLTALPHRTALEVVKALYNFRLGLFSFVIISCSFPAFLCKIVNILMHMSPQRQLETLSIESWPEHRNFILFTTAGISCTGTARWVSTRMKSFTVSIGGPFVGPWAQALGARFFPKLCIVDPSNFPEIS